MFCLGGGWTRALLFVLIGAAEGRSVATFNFEPSKAARLAPHRGATARRARLIAQHLRQHARRKAQPVVRARAPWRSGPRRRHRPRRLAISHPSAKELAACGRASGGYWLGGPAVALRERVPGYCRARCARARGMLPRPGRASLPWALPLALAFNLGCAKVVAKSLLEFIQVHHILQFVKSYETYNYFSDTCGALLRAPGYVVQGIRSTYFSHPQLNWTPDSR